jgi:hypothetical protein
MSDENVIKFPKKNTTVYKQFCECGNTLEMWIDSSGDAYGMCSRCDLGVGLNPIKLNFKKEDKE